MPRPEMEFHCLLVYAVVLLGCQDMWQQELEEIFRHIEVPALADRIAELGEHSGKGITSCNIYLVYIVDITTGVWVSDDVRDVPRK